jgi:hypothetical protein
VDTDVHPRIDDLVLDLRKASEVAGFLKGTRVSLQSLEKFISSVPKKSRSIYEKTAPLMEA